MKTEYIDMAYTIMGMHHFEDGSKNQIKAMLHFAELYHRHEIDEFDSRSPEEIDEEYI